MVFESPATFMDTSPSIEDVEREIQFHIDFIRTIQGYRNARLLSISKLPSDVLSMIFEHLALANPPPSRPYSAWLPTTQVCRGWREIAFATPRMWSCIYSNTSPDFVRLLLQRSGSAPLHVRSSSSPAKTFIMAFIVNHAHRLTEINIRYSSATNSPFHLDTSFFRNLRTLNLEAFSGWKEPVVDVLLALRKMERLETLELVHVLRKPGTIPDGITAVLPSLTRVRITTHHIGTLLILPRISCPNIQSMIAQCKEMVEPDELAPLASTFYSLIPNPSAWRTMLVSTPTHSRCRASMNIWPEAAGCCVALSKDPPFRLYVEGAPNFQTDLALCSTLPTRGPSALVLQPGAGVNSGALQQFLRALDSVREAYLLDIRDILTVLGDTPARVGADGRLPPFSLSSLNHVSWQQTELISKEQALATLEQMLGARQAIRAGLRQLTIHNSHMRLSEADVAPLRSGVGKLELV